jgi:hypothetical protein
VLFVSRGTFFESIGTPFENSYYLQRMSRSQLLSLRGSKSFVFQESWPFGAFLLAKAPTPRINFTIAYSSPSSKIILYGGEDPTQNIIYDELFTLQVRPTKLWTNPAVNAKTRPPPLGKISYVSLSETFLFSTIFLKIVFFNPLNTKTHISAFTN